MKTPNEAFVTDHFHDALEKKQIHAFFQPIYRSLSGKILGAEALARWIDPEKGMISPAEFIPVLESTGLIYELDMEILRQTCALYRELRDRETPMHSFSVNLSRCDFQNDRLFESVVSILREYGVPHEAVKLEITESAMIEDTDSFERVFQQFRDAGFTIWLDDFGSGYSSLNVLQSYSFDVLKFDMVFLRNLSTKGRNLLGSLIHMAKSLGIHTLVEGVETKQQRAFLMALGCEAMQGYYFSKPLSREDLTALLEQRPGITENLEEKQYWNEIGGFDPLSPNPLKEFEEGKKGKSAAGFASFDSSTALVECSQDEFHYLYATASYQERLRELGFGSTTGLEKALDNTRSTQYLMLRKLFLEAIRKGTVQTIEYAYKGIYYRISAQLLARRTGWAMVALRLNTFDSEQEAKIDQNLLTYSSALFTTYDLVVLIYPDKNLSTRLHTANNLPIYSDGHSIRGSVAKFCEAEIEPADQKRYMRFMDFESMDERLENSSNNYIQGFFRMRWTNHPSIWRTARVTLNPSHSEKIYLLTFQSVQDIETEWLDRTAAEHPELLA